MFTITTPCVNVCGCVTVFFICVCKCVWVCDWFLFVCVSVSLYVLIVKTRTIKLFPGCYAGLGSTDT